MAEENPSGAGGAFPVSLSSGNHTVRLILNGENRLLNVGEVEVFSGATKLVLTSPSQSSTPNPLYPASKGNDGNRTTFCHTNLEKDPFWSAQLPAATTSVDRIVVWNRYDPARGVGEHGAVGRLFPFKIEIRNSANAVVWSKNVNAAFGQCSAEMDVSTVHDISAGTATKSGKNNHQQDMDG